MRTYDFQIVLAAAAPPEAFDGRAFVLQYEGLLFEAFEGDVAPAVTAGVPYLDCTIEAPTLDEAARRVLGFAYSQGLAPVRIEVEPEALAEAA